MANPAFIEPMLLQPSKVLPSGEQWMYELKFDGYRGIAIKNSTYTRLYSRNRNDLTARFLPIVHAVQSLPAADCVLDGEIVCLDANGRPCFEDLQKYADGEHALYFYAFDLLHFNGDPFLSFPLTVRKEKLAELLEEAGPVLRLSAALEGYPSAIVKFCRDHRLEGVVAKRRDSVHRPGERCSSWIKFKTRQEETFVVGGFLLGVDGLSSVAVGFYRSGRFRYAGKLEVYLSRNRKADLLKRLVPLANSESAFTEVPRRRTGDTWNAGITLEEFEKFVWVKPQLEVTVHFQEWTRAGYLRHAKLGEFQL